MIKNIRAIFPSVRAGFSHCAVLALAMLLTTHVAEGAELTETAIPVTLQPISLQPLQQLKTATYEVALSQSGTGSRPWGIVDMSSLGLTDVRQIKHVDVRRIATSVVSLSANIAGCSDMVFVTPDGRAGVQISCDGIGTLGGVPVPVDVILTVSYIK